MPEFKFNDSALNAKLPDFHNAGAKHFKALDSLNQDCKTMTALFWHYSVPKTYVLCSVGANADVKLEWTGKRIVVSEQFHDEAEAAEPCSLSEASASLRFKIHNRRLLEELMDLGIEVLNLDGQKNKEKVRLKLPIKRGKRIVLGKTQSGHDVSSPETRYINTQKALHAGDFEKAVKHFDGAAPNICDKQDYLDAARIFNETGFHAMAGFCFCIADNLEIYETCVEETQAEAQDT